MVKGILHNELFMYLGVDIQTSVVQMVKILCFSSTKYRQLSELIRCSCTEHLNLLTNCCKMQWSHKNSIMNI